MKFNGASIIKKKKDYGQSILQHFNSVKGDLE